MSFFKINPSSLKSSAGVLFAAALGGMIAKGLFSLSFITLSLAGLMYLWAVLIENHLSRKKIIFSILGCVAVLGIVNFIGYGIETDFPIEKTISFCEMNDTWDGPKNEPIDLTKTPNLKARYYKEQQRYRLNPAIKHGIPGATLNNVVLTIRVPKPLTVSTWTVESNNWIPGNSNEKYYEYATRIDEIKYGLPKKTDWNFAIESPKSGDYVINYKIEATGNDGKKTKSIKPIERNFTIHLYD